ncbi:MAG: T9SS type A sorting domain-containing protein [Saprospiraceae bacterium]
MQKIKFWLKIIGLFLLWGVLLPRFVKAQTIDRFVVGTAGQALSNGGYSMDFTLGETVAQTFSNSQLLTQGFQQVWLVTTPIYDIEAEGWSLRVFPNPTPGLLHIETEAAAKAELFDMDGRQLQVANLNLGMSEMNLALLPAGTYFLNLYNAQTQGIKTFKIQKIQ